jgi:hypothetical protein
MHYWKFLVAAAATAASCAQAGTTLPAKFDAGRVYVTPRTASGETLTLYTDSGGGFILGADAAARLHLAVTPATDPQAKAEMGPDAKIAAFPAFAKDEQTPAPPQASVMIVPKVAQIPGWPEQGDGIVGQAWFAGHVWTWDYPAQHFILEDADFAPPKDAHSTPLLFKPGADGARENDFPRIVVRIDGADVPLLLDTGAETYLTPAALTALNDGGPQFRATSMIVASLFDAWHAKHPGWRVIDGAQVTTHSAMIEVPRVEIAGVAAGPVWFTKRSDDAFHKFMSSMMAAQVEGSLGGNALGHLRMTIDYPRAMAWFACEKDCPAK